MSKLHISWWRLLVPFVGAAYAAVMLAGPGSTVIPGSAQLVKSVVCPVGAIETEYSKHTDNSGDQVTSQEQVCVSPSGARQAVGGQVFALLGSAYFALSYIPLQLIFILAKAGGKRPMKPLGWETEREVRTLLARGSKLEAVKLVRAKTGAGLKQSKQYVEVMAGQAALPPALEGTPAGLPHTPVAKLKQLTEMRDTGLITGREYDSKKSDILAKL